MLTLTLIVLIYVLYRYAGVLASEYDKVFALIALILTLLCSAYLIVDSVHPIR